MLQALEAGAEQPSVGDTKKVHQDKKEVGRARKGEGPVATQKQRSAPHYCRKHARLRQHVDEVTRTNDGQCWRPATAGPVNLEQPAAREAMRRP